MIPENGPLPEGQCVARIRIDLDEKVVDHVSNMKFYTVHVERNGAGKYLLLHIFDTTGAVRP